MTDPHPQYAALWPRGPRQATVKPLAKRLDTLDGKTVAWVWDYVFRGDQMFPLIQAGLAEKFPGSTFVPYTAFGNAHGHDEREMLAALPQRLREEKVDAVVVGVGA